MRTWIPCTVMIVPLMAACGGDAGWTGTVRDSAGVTIVENGERGMWAANEAWQVEEALRIGTAEGEAEYQFGQLVSVDEDAEGRLYVLDQQAQEVRVFDAAGAYLRTLGRPGQGPGELSRGVAAVLVGIGDTIFVPDLLLQRMTMYTVDAGEAGTFPIPLDQGLSLRWEMTPRNTFLQQVRTITLPNQPDTVPETNMILERTTDGTLQDTVLALLVGQTFQFNEGGPQIRLFEPEPIWALLPEGRIATAVNSTYRIKVYRLDGSLERVITRPFEREPVSEADREAFRRLLRDAWQRQGVPPQAVQQLMGNVGFADFYPAFAQLMAGPDGSLLVQHIQSAEQAGETAETFNAQDVGAPTWDAFDADGRYLGAVRFPDRFSPIRYKNGHFLGIWRDEMDVQHVMVLAPAALMAG